MRKTRAMRRRFAGWLCLLAHLAGTLCPTANGLTLNPPNAAVGVTQYHWDLANRLMGVTLPNGREYAYHYDYRGRRTGIIEGGTATNPLRTQISFSEGLSAAEWESSATQPEAPVTISML